MLAHLGMSDWGAAARAIHVLSVVVWIGGVSFMTTVVLPAGRGKAPKEWAREFEAYERRFSRQARGAVLLALLSGLYMLYRYDMWERFSQAGDWWMHLMVGVWLLFAIALFIVEPLIRRRAARGAAGPAPEASLALMLRLHRIALAVSLFAVLAAVAGSHGLF